MRCRGLGVLLAAVTALAACSGSDAEPEPEAAPRTEAAGDTEQPAPLGIDFEVFGSQVDGSVRVGGSVEFEVSVVSVGAERGEWNVSTSPDLDPGVTVSGVPATVDFAASDEVTFAVTLSADATAMVGDQGSLDVVFEPPVASNRSEIGASTIRYTVVEANAVLGPVAGADAFGAGPDGGSFDPTANDTAGDAALDPGSLRIVAAPSVGSLTVTGPGELTWVPDEFGTATVATYEICDANSLCTTGEINLWQTR